VNVPARFLLATVTLGTNFIELHIIPAVALEAADVVEASLVGVARCQRLDAQVEGDNTILAYGVVLPLFPSPAGLVYAALIALLRISR